MQSGRERAKNDVTFRKYSGHVTYGRNLAFTKNARDLPDDPHKCVQDGTDRKAQ